MPPTRRLRYFAYDSIDNPWVGGGGAYRDLEVLARFYPEFSDIKLYVGYYPGAKTQQIGKVEIIPLGFGKSEIVSRISYVLIANWKMLFWKQTCIGITQSLYSPFPVAIIHRSSLYGLVHHIIGKNWVRKVGQPLGFIFHRIEWLLLGIPRHFVAINDSLVKEIRKYNPSAKIFRSGNGFDPELLNLNDTSELNSPNILFVGRIDRFMKGLDYLVEAFAAIASKYSLLKLIIAGRSDAATEAVLFELAQIHGIETRVIFKRNITEPEKRELLSYCTFFCSPSRFEGWGIAALEANAAGKPVVVSDADGFRNSIKDGYSGVLVDLSNPKNLPIALENMLDHVEVRKKMGQQAREWARQFSWESIAEKEVAWLKAEFGWEKPKPN